jgi:hypothetical protein
MPPLTEFLPLFIAGIVFFGILIAMNLKKAKTE